MKTEKHTTKKATASEIRESLRIHDEIQKEVAALTGDRKGEQKKEHFCDHEESECKELKGTGGCNMEKITVRDGECFRVESDFKIDMKTGEVEIIKQAIIKEDIPPIEPTVDEMLAILQTEFTDVSLYIIEDGWAVDLYDAYDKVKYSTDYLEDVRGKSPRDVLRNALKGVRGLRGEQNGE